MIDSYEIVLYVFKDGVSSTKTPAYSLKETALECNRLLNEYDCIEGENIKLSVRDRVRECVILTLDIHDLKAVKQANEFVDVCGSPGGGGDSSAGCGPGTVQLGRARG